MLWEHLPLAVGAMVVAGLHVARERLLPRSGGVWVAILDAALLVAELLMFVTLLIPKALDVLGNLVVKLSVVQYRVRVAWRTGQSTTEPPAEE